MKKRKIPLRKCISCGENKNKKDLLRIVKTTENEIKIDKSGKINGRGAYICHSTECVENAIKNNKINRNLKTEIDESIYELLREEVK